jgi:hypothetical protein
MQIGLERIVSRRIGSRYRIRLTGWKNGRVSREYKADEEWEGKAVGRRIMIKGTFGFVYCSDNGFGMGVFTIKGEQFIGVDSGGVNYDGTAKEQEDGSIVLDVMLVPPELETVQSRGLSATAAHAPICDDSAARLRQWKAARDNVVARQRHGHDQASAR